VGETRKRSTQQREAVARALEGAGGFRSAQDLFDALRNDGAKISLTTVYRTLQYLADEGSVDVLRSKDGEAIYRRCASTEHHHHLVCRECGAAVEIESTEVEDWAERVAERHGFTSVDHLAEIYGVCRKCAK
jgi:Fur family ferric uptake transcriptional regulator